MDFRPLNAAVARHMLVAALVAVLVAALLPTAAFADHNPGNADPCDGADTADDFADYDQARDTHKPSIDCALYRGITSGAGVNSDGAPLYRPGRAVTRAQMAQFIVNTIVAAGYDSALPGGEGRDEFSDISDNFARVAINRLARAEIVGGTGGNRYSPNGFVTRQQMASFIVQAARHVVGEEHPVQRDGNDQFRDVARSNVHKANIEAGADANLFRGTSATTFTPGARVLRDQMATFLVNLLRYAFNPDTAPPPNTADVAIADRNVDAGGEVTGDIAGSNIRSASVSGCGLNDAALEDTDNQAEGIQFAVTIPSSQGSGSCDLTFSVTFDNNSIRRFTETITVTAPNRATVTLDNATVNPGGTVSGAITGNNVTSAVASGCGLTNEPIEDRDSAKAGIQFSEEIPASQPVGNCTITFRVTFSDNTTQDVAAQLKVEEKVGVTTRPELVGAAIVSTSPPGSQNPGTLVRFLFDEAVTGRAPRAGDFRVYSFDASPTPATSAQTESSNTRSVLARFSTITSDIDARDLTVAAVAVGAVRDFENQDNPEGAAPIGAQRDETIRQAGITAAPDLQSVSGFRPIDEATTAVDFTFDEAAYVVNRGGFNLVLEDGRTASCQGPTPSSETGSGTSQAGGNGTTTITAVCTNPSTTNSTTQLTGANVRRGYVNADTVSDQRQVSPTVGPDEPEGVYNPLQAAATASGATTDTPDLVSATYQPGAPGADDTVVYTFDEPVVLTTANPVTGAPVNLFQVYNTAGEEFQAETARRSADRTITATFEPGTLTDAVGASVRPGAVNGVTGAGTDQPNRADEVGVANSTTRTITPGKTQAPDLIGVAINRSAGSATYTFDEAVNATMAGDNAAAPGNFKLWGSKGELYECIGIPGTSSFEVDGATVTCSQFRAGNSQATNAQVGAAVLGSVAAGAVDDVESGTAKNPEGAVPTTGGNGQPEN